jgi:hypothetical protein
MQKTINRENIKALVMADDALAHHLKKAEEHLIEAVRLFQLEYPQKPPDRHPDYVARLTRAQEMVTGLFREELIRIRGPIKVAAKKRKK